MKVINVSEGPIFLDDVNISLPYTGRHEIIEIPDLKALRSNTLRFCIAAKYCLDATKKLPSTKEIEDAKLNFKTRLQEAEAQVSKYEKIKDTFVSDARPGLHDRPAAMRGIPSAKITTENFKQDGKISVVWSGPACFPPDAKVLTSVGIKKIKDIEVGDMVFTHEGRLRKVLRTYQRDYHGEMIRLKSSLDSEEILLTPNHSVIAIKGAPCIRRKCQTCKPTCLTQYNIVKRNYGSGTYLNCPNGPYKKYKTEKIPASELTENDFLILPKLFLPENIKRISLKDYQGEYKKYSTDNEYMWPSPHENCTYKTILAKKNGVPVNWFYSPKKLNPQNLEKARKILRNDIPEYHKELKQGNRISIYLDLDFDFGRFIGLYLAEGSSSKTVAFSLHEKETHLSDFICKFSEERLGLKATIIFDPERKSQTVNINSILVSNFLNNCCGKDCYSKHFPEFSYRAPKSFVDGLIKGFWDGDGTKYARKKDNTVKLGTVSESLAYGLRLLLSHFGITASIQIEKKHDAIFKGKRYVYKKPRIFYVIKISGKQIYENDWLLNFSVNSRPHIPKNYREREYYSDDKNSYCKIKKISKESYSGIVFDLEIEEDHTYLVYGKQFSNSDGGGYARMNRKFMFGLSDKGVNVRYDTTPSMDDMDRKTKEKINKLTTVKVPFDAPKVYGMTAPLIYDWSRYKLLFTMMETRKLHPDYVERCNCADEIVVPSKWCKEVFIESGVKKPIDVVPLGVDTSIYTPDAEPISFSQNLKDFVFLSVFGWSSRKGPDVLLRAYLEEFTGDEPVSLLLSTRYFGSTDESKKQIIRNEIARISSMVKNPNKPHICLFGDVLSDAMMPKLYAASDAFVLISRGEGFGLPAIEAAACNLPVITSRYSGHTDFCDDTNSYLVDVDGFRVFNDDLSKVSYFYEGAEFPIFGKKAIEQTRYLMRYVYEHPDEAQEKANLLTDKVVKEYNWEVCIDSMYEKLKRTFESFE